MFVDVFNYDMQLCDVKLTCVCVCVLYKATDCSDCSCSVDTKLTENEENVRSK